MNEIIKHITDKRFTRLHFFYIYIYLQCWQRWYQQRPCEKLSVSEFPRLLATEIDQRKLNTPFRFCKPLFVKYKPFSENQIIWSQLASNMNVFARRRLTNVWGCQTEFSWIDCMTVVWYDVGRFLCPVFLILAQYERSETLQLYIVDDIYKKKVLRFNDFNCANTKRKRFQRKQNNKRKFSIIFTKCI